ncbi:DUF2937 family protein [Amphritea sp. 1_MG-2023]|uniref:DUF2937 family protein n=1 Tax=Amphritea sp. 1_MG-2023 TaxID=3062670 RepID=UPI0026E472A5|nr:DUF2937 family protein [Amphritea sp. 1_MG-2023]MDO6562965.1 DUF2937 family protein [Amphritea sp. 1_MG-2023]
MIARLIDKLLFGITLLLALQVPQLADHYQQFLNGLYESTRWQVAGYQHTAQSFGYADINAMIEHHRHNSVASVRADAEQKQATLAHYQQLQSGIELFSRGTLIDKSLYMATPSRYHYLEKTFHNFTPGIPLTMEGLIFGVIVGLLLNLFITLPITLMARQITRLRLRKTRMQKTPTG